MLGNEREPKSCSFAMTGCSSAGEALKNSSAVIWVDTRTCVVDGDDDVSYSLRIDGDLGGASGVNVSVLDQVRQNSFEPNAIGHRNHRRLRFYSKSGVRR